MKILVVGGAGYIGSALSQRLAMTHRVTIVDPLWHKESPREITGCEMIVKDIQAVERLDEFDVIFHLAALAGIEKCEKESREFVEYCNIGTTKKVVEIANMMPKCKLIFASTSAIYGNPSKYGISKLMAEYLVCNRPNSVCLRLPTVYGLSPCMRPGIFVHDLVKEAVKTGEINLWNSEMYRPFLHIETIIDCFINSDLGERGVIDLVTFCNTKFATKGDIAYEIWRQRRSVHTHIVERSKRFEQDFRFCGSPPLGDEFCDEILEIIRYYEEQL